MIRFLKSNLLKQQSRKADSEHAPAPQGSEHLGGSTSGEQLKLLDELIKDIYPNPPLFSVISWGNAATHWLATTLNDIPGIFALHSANTALRRLVSANLDDVTYMKFVGEIASGSRAAGDVHGIDRYSVELLKSEFGDNIRFCVLVRDPIPRLRSQLAHYERLQFLPRSDISYLSKMYPELETIIPEKTYENYLFAHACNMLNALVDEVKVGPIFRMEDIVSSAADLQKMVHFISHGMTVELELLERLQKSSRSNSRSHKFAGRFTPWHLECLDYVVASEVRKMYADLGYTTTWELY